MASIRHLGPRPLEPFTPAEVREQITGQIATAGAFSTSVQPSPALRAMICLAANCGILEVDLATLPLAAVAGLRSDPMLRLPAGPGHRMAWTWPETIEAVEAYVNARPTPLPQFAPLLFLVGDGRPWIELDTRGRLLGGDLIAWRYRQYVLALGQRRRGRLLRALRKTLRQLAGEVADPATMDLIMGRAGAEAAGQEAEANVKAACLHVRQRIMGESPEP